MSQKIAHFFVSPTSNGNNSEMVCPIYLKIYVLRVPNGESWHTEFQVILTNHFRIIAIGSWGCEKVCIFFLGHPVCTQNNRTSCHISGGLWVPDKVIHQPAPQQALVSG